MRHLNIALAAALVAALSLHLACGQKDGGGNDGDGKNPNGQLQTGVQTSGTAANLSKAEQNMVPGSLAIEDQGPGRDRNPCAYATSLGGCQPALLKIYLNIAKMMFGQTRSTVTRAAEELNGREAGTGTTRGSMANRIPAMSYKIESDNKWSAFLLGGSGNLGYVAVDESASVKHYTLTYDNTTMSGIPTDQKSKVETVVEYTNENNFTLRTTITDRACNPDDVRAPTRIGVHIVKSAGVWQGKATMYSPLWYWTDSSALACGNTPTDLTKTFFLTNFAGDDSKTTASIHMTHGDITDVADITDWPMSAACTDASHFSEYCGPPDPETGFTILPLDIATSMPNPYCVTAGSNTVTWGSPCASSESIISTPTYSDTSYWIAPSEFGALSITLPTAL